MVEHGGGPQPPRGEAAIGEALRSARVAQRQGEGGGVQRAHLADPERPRAAGLQGGALQWSRHRPRQAR